MRILHSSDLHLSERKRETVEALNEILSLASCLNVDVLTLSGDFDSGLDAEVLRPRLRRIFSGNNDFGSNFIVAV
ncbi:MAG: hypothetical protein H5T50_08675 [Nitrososphaeria archaeon]|nr:hypothetical protein [Nitrososphaeria archaeon]